MKSVAGKIVITVVFICLLAACGVQNNKPNRGQLQTEQQSDQNDHAIPLRSYAETDRIFTKTPFVMPIKAEWYVLWGGTNEKLNYHYAYASQRYAFDLVIKKNGQTYEGDRKKNDSYYAYGKELIAPASGTVVQIESGVSDNEPVGKMNAAQPFGNYVMIDHGNSEYSVIAHMKYQSAAVNVGDEVKQGDTIGLCGNSGNSSEPHIHFQVSDSPDLKRGKSIRIRFDSGENPIRGDVVHAS